MYFAPYYVHRSTMNSRTVIRNMTIDSQLGNQSTHRYHTLCLSQFVSNLPYNFTYPNNKYHIQDEMKDCVLNLIRVPSSVALLVENLIAEKLSFYGSPQNIDTVEVACFLANALHTTAKGRTHIYPESYHRLQYLIVSRKFAAVGDLLHVDNYTSDSDN